MTWKTTKFDGAWCVAMIVASLVAGCYGETWSAVVFGICAGNQFQICMAGMWWNSMRSTHKQNRELALELIEHELTGGMNSR